MKTCLTIAGSDCSGGAGIQADLKTFSALGCFGMSVVVSVVAENTSRVLAIGDVSPDMIAAQMDAVFEDMPVDGVKVGMLSNTRAIQVVAEKLKAYGPEIVVVDPVMQAKGGCALIQRDALTALKEEILPLARLLTPNIPEAEALTGLSIAGLPEMKQAAARLRDMGAQQVLIKGGHLAGAASDILLDGTDYHVFTHPRIDSRNTHGTGCTLSSAITAKLARSPLEAVREGKDYVTEAIRYGLPLGNGHGPTNHFYELYQLKGWNT